MVKVYIIRIPGNLHTAPTHYYTNKPPNLEKLQRGTTVRIIEMEEKEYQSIPATCDSESFFAELEG